MHIFRFYKDESNNFVIAAHFLESKLHGRGAPEPVAPSSSKEAVSYCFFRCKICRFHDFFSPGFGLQDNSPLYWMKKMMTMKKMRQFSGSRVLYHGPQDGDGRAAAAQDRRRRQEQGGEDARGGVRYGRGQAERPEPGAAEGRAHAGGIYSYFSFFTLLFSPVTTFLHSKMTLFCSQC